MKTLDKKLTENCKNKAWSNKIYVAVTIKYKKAALNS